MRYVVLTNSRSCFIEDEELALPQDRPCESQYLPLSYGEVAASGSYLRIKSNAACVCLAINHGRGLGRRSGLGKREQPGGAERVVHLRVVEFVERVEVLAECTAQQLWLECTVSNETNDENEIYIQFAVLW